VHNSPALSIPGSDTFTLRPATAGDERLIADRFKGADIHKTEIFAIAFSIELG
jgi:hypothetical protein